MGLLAYNKYKKLVSGNYRSGLSLRAKAVTSRLKSLINKGRPSLSKRKQDQYQSQDCQKQRFSPDRPLCKECFILMLRLFPVEQECRNEQEKYPYIQKRNPVPVIPRHRPGQFLTDEPE